MDSKFIFRIINGGFLILLGFLFFSQVINGDFYLEKAKNNYIKAVNYPPIRGVIYDRNGVTLAVDGPAFNIAVVPYQTGRIKDELFNGLSRFSGVKVEKINSAYKRGFQNLFSPVDVLENLPKQTALNLKEEFGEDVMLRIVPRRRYIFPSDFSHVLGYVKEAGAVYNNLKQYGYSPSQRIGVSGLEKFYNSYLKGSYGAELLEVNSKGEIVGFLGKTERVKGKDLSLTLDGKMQVIACQKLDKRRGSVVILDVNSGAVLCLASSPSFDANKFMYGSDVEGVFNNPDRPLINRPVQGLYPPGSIFKPIVALGALEEGIITPRTSFNCDGKMEYGGMEFKCWSVHGRQDLNQALAHSCNVYFWNLALKMKAEKISKWAKLFSMDELTSIDLPYEKKGLVPGRLWKKKRFRTPWFGGDSLNFSIGQGYLQITPLRAAVFMAVFANKGYGIYPYLVDSIEGMSLPRPVRFRLPFSGDNITEVSRGLRGAVASEEGTAHLLESLGLEIAGKTGTAQTTGPSHGWFLGFFPYSRPKYVVCVMLENAGSSSEAVKLTYQILNQYKKFGVL